MICSLIPAVRVSDNTSAMKYGVSPSRAFLTASSKGGGRMQEQAKVHAMSARKLVQYNVVMMMRVDHSSEKGRATYTRIRL